MSKHTPGPWALWGTANPSQVISYKEGFIAQTVGGNDVANARLIAAAPTQHEEMLRYLPIIERAEANPELWGVLSHGTGIATANGYRAAIAKALGESD